MANNTNNIPQPGVLLEDPGGGMSFPWYLYFTQQGLLSGSGIPPDRFGTNGDFYFRKDGTVGTSTLIYFKSANVWTGIL